MHLCLLIVKCAETAALMNASAQEKKVVICGKLPFPDA